MSFSSGPGTSPLLPHLLSRLDRTLPPALRAADADTVRRARLLAVASLIFPVPTLGFGVYTFAAWGFPNPLGIAFVIAAALMGSPALVMRATGSVRLAGLVMTLACFGIDFFVAVGSGGFVVTALMWVTATPLIAAYFVGHRLSFVMAGLATVGYTVLYWTEQTGLTSAAQAQTVADDRVTLFALIVITFLLALFGWLYERVTLQGLRRLYDRLQEAHAALQASETRYRTLIEQASDAIFIGRPGAGLVEVNGLACALTGYPRAELLQQTTEQLLRDPKERALLRALSVPGDIQRFETLLRRADGTEVPVEVRATRIDGGLVQAIVRDVSGWHAYQDELVRARDEAEQLSRLKTSFLANMSHEIRTPLTSILGFAEALAFEATGAPRQYAEVIEQAGRRLLHTLNSVLDLSRLESRTFALDLDTHDLVPLTRQILHHFTPQLQRAGLHLRLALPDTLPARIDPVAFDRVLTNLVANAVKFTRQGQITVQLCGAGPYARLIVADTGVGIDAAFLPHLFSEFRQESQGLSRAFEGAGLGLAIVHHLVTLMEGQVAVESEKGVGTSFTVSLPVHD